MRSISIVCAFIVCDLASLPIHPVWIEGSGNIELSQNVCTIHAPDKALIHWDDFSIGKGEILDWIQPSSESVVINVVNLPAPSFIDGQMKANGSVWLFNPSGVFIGPQGKIETSNFFAAAISFEGFEKRGGEMGQIRMEGSIVARINPFEGGNVALLGKSVDCFAGGNIDVSGGTRAGSVSLGKGELFGSSLTSETIWVDNHFRIQASSINGKGGNILIWGDLAANACGDFVALGKEQGGFVEISSPHFIDWNGTIDLRAADVGQSGTLLLDPTDITISAAASTAGVVIGNPTTLPALTPVNIQNTAIQTALLTANVAITTNTLPDQGAAGNIVVNAPITWATANSLSLTAAGTVTVNAGANIRVVNVGGTGSISILANGDINLFADVRNANSDVGTAGGGGNVTVRSFGGNILLMGGTAANQSVSVCARKGITEVTADVGNVSIIAGSAANCLATIGERGQQVFAGPANIATAFGPLNVNVGGDLLIQGGSANICYANIGKIGSRPTGGLVRNVDSSDINVNVAGSLTINGSTSGSFAEAFIGHGGSASGLGAATAVNGNININVRNNLLIQGRSSSFTFIGSGAAGPSVGIYTLCVGGNMTVQSTVNAGFHGFYDFGDVVPIAGFLHTYQLYIGGNLTLDGRRGFAMIRPFNIGSNPAQYPPNIICHVGGEINLLGGSNSFAIFNWPISTPGAPVSELTKLYEIWAGGKIRCYNAPPGTANVGASLFYAYSYVLGVSTLQSIGTVDVRSANDIVQASGTPSFANYFSNVGSLSMIADAGFAPGQMWTAKSAIVNGVNIFAGTLLGADSPGNSSNGIGAVAFDTNYYSLDFATYPQGPNGVQPPLFPPIASPSTSPSSYTFFDINIQSGNQFSDGTEGNFSNIGLDLSEVAFTSSQTDITIVGFQNITAQDASLNSNEDILVLAQNDISLQSASVVAARNIDFVVDNQAPFSPLIGPGAFNMNAGSLFDSATGYIRVYTARQSLNTIDPAAQFISGGVPFTFTPGALFIDTNQEQWCVYYPDGNQGFPFKIFYKDCLQILLEQAMVVVDEFLVDLHPYNEFPGWKVEFWMRQADVFGEPYYLRRRHLNTLNHAKSWTVLLP